MREGGRFCEKGAGRVVVRESGKGGRGRRRGKDRRNGRRAAIEFCAQQATAGFRDDARTRKLGESPKGV